MLVWEIWKDQGARLAKTMTAMLMRGQRTRTMTAEGLETALLEAYRHGMLAADGFVEAEIRSGMLIRKVD